MTQQARTKTRAPRCARCDDKQCRKGRDCFGVDPADLAAYDNGAVGRIHRAVAAVEARCRGSETRLGDTIRLAREMGARRLGLAFCVGLSEEARIVDELLGREFEVLSACCKVCAVSKDDLDLERVRPGARFEASCHPVGQARLLNESGTELNIICGLCVGHDAIFAKFSEAPVTTLIAKDRALAHNPAGAIYCQYARRSLPSEGSIL